jgi:hypothetical protein
MQCECCFKSGIGRHVVVSRQLIDPVAGAPALNQPQALSSLRISSTMAWLWSTQRHSVVKENPLTNEVLNAYARA